MSRSSVIVLAIGILAAVGLGWFMLSADVTSYEDKYTSCMDAKRGCGYPSFTKSWLPGYTIELMPHSPEADGSQHPGSARSRPTTAVAERNTPRRRREMKAVAILIGLPCWRCWCSSARWCGWSSTTPGCVGE